MKHQQSLVAAPRGIAVFISERSEFELIGNGCAGTALQSRCGLEQSGGGERQLVLHTSRACSSLDVFISDRCGFSVLEKRPCRDNAPEWVWAGNGDAKL